MHGAAEPCEGIGWSGEEQVMDEWLLDSGGLLECGTTLCKACACDCDCDCDCGDYEYICGRVRTGAHAQASSNADANTSSHISTHSYAAASESDGVRRPWTTLRCGLPEYPY